MTPSIAPHVFVVRVETDATVIAIVDVAARNLRRTVRIPGGLAAVDEIIEGIVADAVPGGLPDSKTAAFVKAGARLRGALAAARERLVDEESTVVPVRFPGRMDFVTLDGEAVAAALADDIGEVVDGLRALGARENARIVLLGGVASVPGLITSIPGVHVDEATAADLDLDALLDGAIRETTGPEVEESEDPALVSTSTALVLYRPSGALVPIGAPPVARRGWRYVVRRMWPVAAATAVLLVVVGAGAASGFGNTDDGRGPFSTIVQVDPGAGSATPSAPVASPTAAPTPGVPGAGTPGDRPLDRKDPKRTTTVPDPGAGAVATVPDPPSGGGASDPSPVSTPPPTDPPADPTDPPTDPTPDPDPPDPGILCGLLCSVLG